MTCSVGPPSTNARRHLGLVAFNAESERILPVPAPRGDRKRDFMDGLGEFDLLTMAAVARLLHCSKAHICNVIAGRVHGCPPLPAVCLGRRKLVRRDSLIAWLADNEQTVVSAKIRTSPERGRKNA